MRPTVTLTDNELAELIFSNATIERDGIKLNSWFDTERNEKIVDVITPRGTTKISFKVDMVDDIAEILKRTVEKEC